MIYTTKVRRDINPPNLTVHIRDEQGDYTFFPIDQIETRLKDARAFAAAIEKAAWLISAMFCDCGLPRDEYVGYWACPQDGSMVLKPECVTFGELQIGDKFYSASDLVGQEKMRVKTSDAWEWGNCEFVSGGLKMKYGPLASVVRV